MPNRRPRPATTPPSTRPSRGRTSPWVRNVVWMSFMDLASGSRSMTQRSAVDATPTSGFDPDLCVGVLGTLLQDGAEQGVPQRQLAGGVPEVEAGAIHHVGEPDAGLRVGEPERAATARSAEC